MQFLYFQNNITMTALTATKIIRMCFNDVILSAKLQSVGVALGYDHDIYISLL